MKNSFDDFQLEPLEPRLLLSATPLFPQALVVIPASENLAAVQAQDVGQQATHAEHRSASYDPAAQVTGLFARAQPVVSYAAVSPQGAAGGGQAKGTSQAARGSSELQAVLKLDVAPISQPTNSLHHEASSTIIDASVAQHTTSSSVTGSSTGGSKAVSPALSANTTTNTIVKTLNAAQPPPSSGTLNYTAGPQGSNLTLTLDAHNRAQLDLIDNTTGAIVASSPLHQVNRVVVTGANNANDTLTVNMTKPFWLSGGISFSGGAGGYDTLAVTAPAGGNVDYTALGGGAGTADVTSGGHSTLISFTGLEPVNITASSYTFTPSPANASAAVNLTIETGTYTDTTTGTTETVNLLTGSFGGTAFEKVNLVGVSNLTIDLTGAFDGSTTPYTGNDTVTIASDFVSPQLKNVTIDTGAGTNTVTVAASSIALPVSGGSFTVDGGAGTTSLVVSGSYTTASVNATSATSGTLSLDGSSLNFSNISSLQTPSTTPPPDLQTYIDNLLAGETSSFTATEQLPAASLGGMLDLYNVQLKVTANLSQAAVWGGTVTITAGSGTLFPGKSFSASITSSTTDPAVTGSYDISKSTYSLKVPSTATMTLTVGEALVINASNFSLGYDPNGSATQILETAAIAATVNSPQFSGFTDGTLTNFVLQANGFSFDGFTLTSSSEPSLNGVITASSATLTVSNFSVSYGGGTTPASLTGTVGLQLSNFELYSTGGLVQFSANSVTPGYDFSSFDGTSTTGQLSITIAGFKLKLGNALQVTTGGNVVLTPGQPVMATIAAATLNSPQFTGMGSLQVKHLDLRQNGFTVGSVTWASSGSVSIGNIIQAGGVTLTLSSLGLQYGTTPAMTGGITVSASGVVLFPTVPLVDLQLGTLSGSYNFTDANHPAAYLGLQIPNLDIPLGDALTIHLGAVELNPGFSPIVQVMDPTVTVNLFSGVTPNAIPLSSLITNFSSFDLTPTGFNLGSFTISDSSTVTIGNFFSLSSLSIIVSNFAVDVSNTTPISGTITTTLGTLTLFPGSTVFTSTFTSLTGSYDFSSMTSPGQFTFSADMSLSIAGQLAIAANGVTLTPGASTIATINKATLSFAPLNNLAVTINGVVVQPTGVSIASAAATLTTNITLGSILTIQKPAITLTNIDYVFGSGLTGTVGIDSSGASLTLGTALDTSSGKFTGTYDIATGALSATLDSFNVGVAGFATFSAGSVSIAYTPASDGSAEFLVGATGLNAFLGLGSGTSATGVEVSSATFALAIFEAGGTITYSLDAQGAASLVNMPTGSLSITAGNLEFLSNTAGAVSSVVTVGGNAVNLDFTGNEQSVFATNLSMSVGTFASLSGDFGFSEVTSGGQTYITIGATNVNAIVAAGSVNVTITGASLGLLIEPGTSGAPTTYALAAGGGADSLNGVSGLTLTGTGLTVRVRNGLDPTAVTGLPTQVDTPSGSVSLDFSSLGSGTGNITDVEGDVTLAIANFVSITGGFGFQQFTDGTSTYFAVGASDLTIVLGTSATNLTIDNASLGLVIEPGSGGNPTTYALEATASKVALNGVPGFTMVGSSLLVRVRQGLDLSGDTSVPTSVQTPNGPVTLDFSGLGSGTTNVTDIEGSLTLSVTGFGSLQGDFGFQTFTDGTTGTTEWAVGATGVIVTVGTATTNFTVSDASLALLVRPGDSVSPTTYALEATASSASLNGAGDLSLTATNLLVRIRQGLDLSTASGLPTTVQTSGGAATLDFSGLAAGSSNLIDVEGSVKLTVGSFVTLSGNFGIQSYTDGTDNYLEFGGTGITATLTAGSVNLTVANATLGVVVKQGTTTSYAVEATGSSDPADTSLNGVPGLTLNASNLLVRASNGLDVSALPATLPGTIHTSGGDVTLDFSGLPSGTTAVTDIEGHLSLGIAGFASLQGDFGFQKFTDGSGSDLAIGAKNVSAVLGTPTVNVTVAGASLALLVKPGVGYDLIANGGSDALNGVPGLTLSASGLRVISRQGLDPSTVSGLPASVEVPGGSVSFGSSLLGNSFLTGSTDVTAISGNITLNVANFVSLNGDFSFTKSTSGTLTKILVGATGVNAFVGSADQTFGVQITGASLGVVIYRDTTTSGSTYALEASAPSITIKGLPSDITLSGSASVAINTTGGAVNETIPSTGQTISFTDGTNGTPDQSNIRSIGGSLTLGIGTIVTLQGDFSFTSIVTGSGTSAITKLLVGAANVSTAAGSTISPSGSSDTFNLSNGKLGLVVFENGTGSSDYALTASATATVAVGTALSGSATITIRINTTTSAQSETVTVGTTSVSVVFSASEVATTSSGSLVPFEQISLGNASLSIDNTLIITAGQATSTTPVTGATSIPLTSVTLTVQTPDGSEVLLKISADSAVYTSFSATVTASAASAAGLPVRSDGGSWVAGDKALVLTNVTFSIGSVVTFTAQKIDVQHFTSGTAPNTVTTDSFGFTTATIAFYAGGKPMVSLSGSPSFHYSTADGFKLDSFNISGISFLGGADPLGNVPLGPVTLVDPSVSIGNFDFGFVSGTTTADLSATITISVAKATIGAATSPVHATLTGVSGSFGVVAVFNLANLTALPSISANGFTMQADSFLIAIGPYLTISATGTTANPLYFNPTAAPTQVLISFATLQATLNVGAVSISGTAYNFAIQGNGSFVAGIGFGVSLTLGQNANGSPDTGGLGWPSWLPLKSATVSLFWTDFNTAPTNFVIELSATVSTSEFKGLPLQMTGSVTDLVIDPSLIAQGKFPITSVGSIGINVEGNIFAGEISGTLIVGVVRFDANGAVVDGLNNLVGTTTPGVGPFTSAFYAGIGASFSLGGMSGFTIMIGLSDFGPLEVYVEAGVPIPLGETGLFLSNFRGDIKFGTSFPTLNISNPPQASDALQLRQPAFQTPASLTEAQWQAQLEAQVAHQYHSGATPGSGWLNLLQGPFIIGGGVTLYAANQDAFRVDGDIYFDTTGNILVMGSATFGDTLSVGVKMYANLSALINAAATDQSSVSLSVLFLMEVPSQNTLNPITPPIYSLYGVTTFSYSNNVLQLSIAGAADLNVLGGLKAHVQATLTLAFTASSLTDTSFTVTLSDGSFSIPEIQSTPLGTAAGTMTIQTANGSINIWGGFKLSPNLNGLKSLGIYASGNVFIRLNTTDQVKQVTLSNGTLTLNPLSFDIYVSGAANFKVSTYQVFQLKGTLNFEIGPNSLTLFVGADQLLMGPDPTHPILTFNANGVIFVQVVGTSQIPMGFAAKMMLSLGGSVPGVTFNENWLLVMNTTGVEITYDIPAPIGNTAPVPTVMGPDYSSSNPFALISYETVVNGQRTLVIPSGPPGNGLSSYATWTPTQPNTPYLIILGRGSLSVANSFVLTGNINIDAVLGSSGFTFNLEANAALALQVNGTKVFSFVAYGGIELSNAGVVAAFALSLSPGFSIPGSLGFSLTGSFLLQLNTTGALAIVNNITVPAGTNGLFAQVHAVGDLKFFGGVVDLNGRFDLSATTTNLIIAVDAHITFLNATFNASGFAAIYYDAHPGVALRIQLGLPGGANGIAPVPALGSQFVISGVFTLAINTSSITRYDQNDVAIPTGFRVSVATKPDVPLVYLFGFDLSGSLSIGITSAGFDINVSYLHLSLFGLANVTLNGYYHPDGNFSFAGSGGFQYGDHTFGIGGTIYVTISNSGFSASVSGWAAAFGVQVGASGGLSISGGSVDIYVGITVIFYLGTAHFHLGDTSPPPSVAQPPALAGVDNGVLTLIQGSQTGEDYTLTSGANASTVIVSALGYTQTYTGVTSILVNNTGSGTDTILMSSGINLPVTVGSGNNTITTGSGVTTDITGNGDNTVTTGDNATVTIAGNGNNTVSTGAGSTVLISGSGANTVTTKGGSKPFTILGNGNNTVTVSNGGTFTFKVEGSGANSITITGGSPTVKLTSNASGANQILISTSGTSKVEIGGNGNNRVNVAGTGAPAITVTGDGANRITTGAGAATITLQGSGANNVTTGAGVATIYDEGTGGTTIVGGPGGGVLIGGVTAGGAAFTTKGASSLTTAYGNFRVQISGYADYVLNDASLKYGAFSLTLSGVNDVTLTAVAGQDAHTFTLGSWTGDATLYGAGGDNSANITGSQNFFVTANQIRDGTEEVTYSGIQMLNLVGAADGLSYYVQSTAAGVITSVATGGAASFVAVGSTAGQVPSAAGVVSTIKGTLSVSGGGSMVVDDTGSSTAQSGTLNATSLTGFGMGSGGIQYEGLSLLTVNLGSGGNTLAIHGIEAATQTVVDGGSSANDSVNASFAGDFNGRLDLTSFEGGTLVVGGNFNGTLNDTAPGNLASVQIVGSLAAGGVLNADSIDTMSVGQDLAGQVTVSGTLGALAVGGGVSGTVSESGTITSVSIGSLASSGQIDAVNTADASQYSTGSLGDILTMSVGQDLAGGVRVSGNVGTLEVGGELSGTVVVQGALNTLKVSGNDSGSVRESGPVTLISIAGNLAASGTITAVNTTAAVGSIATLNVGQSLAGVVVVSGTIGKLEVGGDLSGSVTESGEIKVLTIGGSLTSTGDITVSNPADPTRVLLTPPPTFGNIDAMTVGGDLAGQVIVTGDLVSLSVGGSLSGTVAVQNTLSTLEVSGDVSGTMTESGTITSLAIGGSLTSTGVVAASNTADPTEVPPTPPTTLGNIDAMTVGGDLAGQVIVTGDLASLSVGGSLSGTVAVQNTLSTLEVSGDVSGTVTESGTITSLTIGGSLTSTGSITASDTFDPSALPPVDPPLLGNITTMSVGGDLAGNVTVTGDLGSLSVGGNLSGTVLVQNTLGDLSVAGDVSGAVTESGTIDSLTIGSSLTSTGIIEAVNVTPALGNITTLTIGQDFAGSVIVSGTLETLSITGGQMAPSARLTVGNLGTVTIGPDHLSVGQNLAGVITVSGTLQSLRVAGGTPGTIIAGHIGTIAVYGGFGPVVLNVTENGIQRLVEATSPEQPYPLPDPHAVALAPGQTGYVNFQFYYESGSLANPQLTVRVTNGVSTAPDQYDLSLITYNDAAKFNLARLDASGVAGVRNVVVEGDLLTAVSAQAAAFFMVPGPGGSTVEDATPAGVRLPADHLAGVSIRDFAPDGHIQAASIEGVAFGSFREHGWILSGAQANAHDARELLARGTRIVQAADTFRVAFADLSTQHVALFFATEEHGWYFNNDSILFTVQSVVTANADGTANITTPSNVERGAATALVTVMPVSGWHGRLEDSVVNTIAINGGGASIRTGQWISEGITSGGALGDLILLSHRGITNITAPSIFGSIVSPGPLTGTIQTTGLRIDPISGAVSSVPATIGRLYVVSCDHGQEAGWYHDWRWVAHDGPRVVATTISIGGGGISGGIISRGDLVSRVISEGGISGVIAVQGDLGSSWMSGGSMRRFGGIVSDGPLRGSIVVLGQQIGDVTINGGLRGGDYAVAGGILGNLTINGGLSRGSKLVSGGQIGSASLGTALRLRGWNCGIIAALGPITAAGRAPRGYVVDDAGADPTGPDAIAINAIFTNQSAPLSLDINSLDLGGLALIQTDLGNLYVNCQGDLARPVA